MGGALALRLDAARRGRGAGACAAVLLLLLLLLGAALVASCAGPEATRYARSPQWHDGRFENPPAWPRHPGVGGFFKWQLGGRPSVPGGYRPKVVPNDGRALRENRDRTTVSWIGHASVVIQSGGATIVTDPIFSERIGGVLKRFAPPGVALADLPYVDVVLISHNHRDHLDEASVRALGPRVRYVVPLGLGDWFRARGLLRVTELDWWQRAVLTTAAGAAVTVTMVPAQHWSRRGLSDRNRSLWGGYVVDAGAARIYFAGDSGYPAAFREIGGRLPGIDIALLPIGAYEPRWYMRPQHMDPEEAARAFAELGARLLVPMHFGTFHLTDEPMDEPPRRLAPLVEPRSLKVLPIGGTLVWQPPS